MSITVELSVENTNKYFKRFTLEEKYKGHSGCWIYIFPKNNEILKYWKYRKCLKHINNNDIAVCEEVMFFNSEDQFINEIERFYPYHNHYLVFEFPDDYPEEELFYFKLKYC